MNILIVGLGVMGGAYAKSLSTAGHNVYAVDINKNSIDFAKEHKYIIDGSDEALDFIPIADLIIIGLYPKLILDFLNKYKANFRENQIITDLCGLKTYFLYDAQNVKMKAEYISHHPMAGKEKSGVEYAYMVDFKPANFLICPTDKNTTRAVEVIRQVGLDLGVNRIILVTPEEHDSMIAYTSQLTHAIAVALVNADKEEGTKNFVGDSYRDLTRIARINEELWTELFFGNKNELLDKITTFETELDIIKNALKNDDKESLKEAFRRSTKHRNEME